MRPGPGGNSGNGWPLGVPAGLSPYRGPRCGSWRAPFLVTRSPTSPVQFRTEFLNARVLELKITLQLYTVQL